MDDVEEPAHERADRLRERIYVTFTALAVVLALRAHVEETSIGTAVSTVLITVLGTVLAVFVADFVAHLAIHAVLPSPDRLRHMARVSFGATGVIILPLAFLVLSAAGIWPLRIALTASAVALLATLVAVGFLAVRRVALPLWQRLVVLLAEAILGLAVVGLELLAHG
jgi:hypothetical protein